MATVNLHVSQDFFKLLSLKHQELNIIIQLLETFVDHTWERNDEYVSLQAPLHQTNNKRLSKFYQEFC